MTMRKETVDLSIRSWLCSSQVGSSLDVNLRLCVNRLEIGLINLILGSIQVSISFYSSPYNFTLSKMWLLSVPIHAHMYAIGAQD